MLFWKNSTLNLFVVSTAGAITVVCTLESANQINIFVRVSINTRLPNNVFQNHTAVSVFMSNMEQKDVAQNSIVFVANSQNAQN